MLSKIDKRLNFSEHVSKLCQTASQKLRALERISSYIFTNKLRLITNVFFFYMAAWILHACLHVSKSIFK